MYDVKFQYFLAIFSQFKITQIGNLAMNLIRPNKQKSLHGCVCLKVLVYFPFENDQNDHTQFASKISVFTHNFFAQEPNNRKAQKNHFTEFTTMTPIRDDAMSN